MDKLGQGGMAQVYKAYQPDLERYVAVKILHPHLTGDEEFDARFRREAQAIAALEHPHIVRVYDFETDHGMAFLVMEYLRGTSLKSRVHDLNCGQQPMDLPEAAHIVSAIADALDYAHSRGIVHRDVKPSNVILTEDGRPVLTDFGIARLVDATILTASSGTVGTPAYMSPEQAKGEPGDARSDIYALGVVLYQLCTGQLPFDADTPYAIILKHLTAPLPPPRAIRADLPESIERVILKALAKEPGDRYGTAGEMGRAVRASLKASPGASTLASPSATESSAEAAPGLFKRLTTRQGLFWIAAIVVISLIALFAGASRRIEGRLSGLMETTRSPSPPSSLALEGPGLIEDTWLDPDAPDENRVKSAFSSLRSGPASDRILIACDISRLPPAVMILTATLSLHVEQVSSAQILGKVAAHQLLTFWRPTTATFNTPWHQPGLSPGQDYEERPIDVAEMPNAGWVNIDVTYAVAAWHARQRIGGGLALMMSEDSPPSSAYRIHSMESVDPSLHPKLSIDYVERP